MCACNAAHQKARLYSRFKIRRVPGPMAHKLARGPANLSLGGPGDFEATVIPL